MVYVDDIVITGDDSKGITNLKQFLQKHFLTKDLVKLWYFLGIDIARPKQGINLIKRKYVLGNKDTGLLGSRLVDIWIQIKNSKESRRSNIY